MRKLCSLLLSIKKDLIPCKIPSEAINLLHCSRRSFLQYLPTYGRIKKDFSHNECDR